MRVRNALLSLLLLGDGYGQQLAREFERRTGRPVNIGQVSATLERLLRDGEVADVGEDASGRRRLALTLPGRDAAERWAQEGDEPDSGTALALLASIDRDLAIAYARRRSRLLDAVIAGRSELPDAAPHDDAGTHARWRLEQERERATRLAAAEGAWLGAAIVQLEQDGARLELPSAAEPRRGRPQRTG